METVEIRKSETTALRQMALLLLIISTYQKKKTLPELDLHGVSLCQGERELSSFHLKVPKREIFRSRFLH
jgi:hypothetical protein